MGVTPATVSASDLKFQAETESVTYVHVLLNFERLPFLLFCENYSFEIGRVICNTYIWPNTVVIVTWRLSIGLQMLKHILFIVYCRTAPTYVIHSSRLRPRADYRGPYLTSWGPQIPEIRQPTSVLTNIQPVSDLRGYQGVSQEDGHLLRTIWPHLLTDGTPTTKQNKDNKNKAQ